MSHSPIAQPLAALKTGNALNIKTGLWSNGLTYSMMQGVIDCKSSTAQLIGYLPQPSSPPAVTQDSNLYAAYFFPIRVFLTLKDSYGVGLNTPTINVGFTGATYIDWCSNAAIGKVTGTSLSAMIASSQYNEVAIKSTNKSAVFLNAATPGRVGVYAKMQTVSDATQDIRSVTLVGLMGTTFFY